MPHNITLITTITASLGLALIMGILASRFKLPPIVGYLIAGIIIGPATPGFVADIGLSSQLAEIGVILLMFGVGLHFSLKDLLEVRRIALPGAIVQIIVATMLGIIVARFWGWEIGASLIFGLALSVASTVVLIKALDQRNLLKTTNGRIAVGWLIVEDLAMVLVLVLLPPVSKSLSNYNSHELGIVDNGILVALAISMGKIIAFIGLMLVVGRRIFPWLLGYVAGTNSRELFTLSLISVAVGIAYASAQLFGVSFALGAFFAGMVLRESKLSHRATEESLPFRDAFSVLFFVSVGMLFDPIVLIQHPMKVILVVLIIIIGKSLAAFLLVLAFRYPINTALTVSASLAQIGEFSFILAGLGVSLGILPKEGMSLILAGALISISINHLVFKLIEPAQNWILSNTKLVRAIEFSKDPLAELPMNIKSSELSGHIVLVGFGRVGKRIGSDLIMNGLGIVVVEQNRELVEALRKQGIRAVAGDATDENVLIQAHIAKAQKLVIATPDAIRVRKMIEIARILNPHIETVVRTHSDEESALLKKENLVVVFHGEQELAKNMLSHILGKK